MGALGCFCLENTGGFLETACALKVLLCEGLGLGWLLSLTLNFSATTLVEGPLWWMCSGRDLGYFGLLWDHFGGWAVERLL